MTNTINFQRGQAANKFQNESVVPPVNQSLSAFLGRITSIAITAAFSRVGEYFSSMNAPINSEYLQQSDLIAATELEITAQNPLQELPNEVLNKALRSCLEIQ